MKKNKIYKIENKIYYNIKAKIIEYSLIHLSGFNNDYVEYSIIVKTDYGDWYFKKRYEEFAKLNNELINKIPEINDYFPPRRVFKNSESTIKERIKYFNKYLKFLLSKINIFLFNDIINFLNLEKNLISLIFQKYRMLKINPEEDYILESLESNLDVNNLNLTKKENYYNSIYEYEKKRELSFDWDEPKSVSPSTFVIREFLNNLGEDINNKDDIIKTFESFLIEKRKRVNFSVKDIKELFLGFDVNNFKKNEINEITDNKKTIQLFQWFKENDSNINGENESDSDEESEENDKIPGLLEQIGNYQNNIFAAIGCLNLLEILLNDEFNPDCEKYLNIFKNLKIYEFNYMKLNDIIKNNIGGNKTNIKAIKILSIIFSNKKNEKYQNEIITDNSVYNEYINYLKNCSE
jgi:hypothetical protein